MAGSVYCGPASPLASAHVSSGIQDTKRTNKIQGEFIVIANPLLFTPDQHKSSFIDPK